MSNFELRAPQFVKKTLTDLDALPAETFSALSVALAELAVSVADKDAVDELTAATGVDREQVSDLYQFVMQTRALATRLEWSPSQVAGALVSQLDGIDQGEPLQERVVALLQDPHVGIREKVRSLAAATAPPLVGSQCITDLRPIFATNGDTAEVEGFLRAATMTIDYFEDGSEQSLSLSVDRDSLLSLRQTLDRALEKLDTLHGLLERHGLHDLTIEEEGGDE